MRAEPDKVKVISDWPRPGTVKEVKSLLQMVQYNSVYMGAKKTGELSYPELTAPFRELTRKQAKFRWNARLEEHFRIIKDRLCSDRVMVAYEAHRETRLHTDASPEGIQATLVQKYQH